MTPENNKARTGLYSALNHERFRFSFFGNGNTSEEFLKTGEHEFPD